MCRSVLTRVAPRGARFAGLVLACLLVIRVVGASRAEFARGRAIRVLKATSGADFAPGVPLLLFVLVVTGAALLVLAHGNFAAEGTRWAVQALLRSLSWIVFPSWTIHATCLAFPTLLIAILPSRAWCARGVIP